MQAGRCDKRFPVLPSLPCPTVAQTWGSRPPSSPPDLR